MQIVTRNYINLNKLNMFKGHPKGLLIAAFANLGERFGFYTMMAILVFFLQARYGMSEVEAGDVYSWFYFGIYAMALLGGILADNYTGLGKTIFTGILTMFAGYIIMAIPGMGKWFTYGGLAVIALGNGLFKGNLQALVGNLYEAPQYRHLRDSAFSIFYMFINIGAFFAPHAAEGMLNWLLNQSGFSYNGQLPAMCNAYLSQAPNLDIAKFQEAANAASLTPVTDLSVFAQNYINSVSTGYNYAFGVAGIAMLASMLIYILFKKYLKEGDFNTKTAQAQGVVYEKITPKQIRERMTALGLVFMVVIFFWMSFHQNGLTMSIFARDYTASSVSRFTYLFFNLWSFLGVIATIGGIAMLFNKTNTQKTKLWAIGMTVVGVAVATFQYLSFKPEMSITPGTFQQFNPIFIVFLTPLVVGVFSWLNSRKKEPSTPRKIGYGMIIAALGFVILLIGSFGLTAPKDLMSAGTSLVSPYWLISTYFTLTIAELCLSPMGISFVSKVAPPKYKALMQGGWLCATAIGNKLLFVGTYFWAKLEVWQVWTIFIVCCCISAAIIFCIMKFLERVTAESN